MTPADEAVGCGITSDCVMPPEAKKAAKNGAKAGSLATLETLASLDHR
jgi:hypothetical protein